MAKENKSVVSLVPSLTETLIYCDINVVGRTRYCIHPNEKVEEIPIVGGTKDLNLKKLRELNPDFVIMDKEENTKEMAEKVPFPIITTHVRSISDMGFEFKNLSTKLNNQKLMGLSERTKNLNSTNLHDSNKILNWWVPAKNDPENIVYMIWKDPWMCVGENTFIGDVLKRVFPNKNIWSPGKDPYPKIDLADIPKNTLVLLSSEPFPFAKHKPQIIEEMAWPTALVDGELFSWFGIRSLKFLEGE